ncbi:lipase family protein [Microbacterium thalassium]|uniref:Uncharacterized membrane protein HdeD (DUF308 family)/acetyl esterase/lipase n=1 Tax=Microbacterium thalassium TaxID=362649 RepID=A0A7X0FPV0_9MICO|nr:lipase family protein [Microbacterium thalassium]MBB6391463.1 uncharacterized membrane protein HdeD (DUF308 family)/acetyl esterase/lipase [Microbacterium thalassium]GLK24144.1 hypothetical protein GCM10017607_14620 [Microbacterium thalassium]
MARPRPAAVRLRWSALPWFVRQAPPRVVLLVGLATVWVGLLLITRPLTSVFLLAVYVGLSAVVSGLFDFAVSHGGTWWGRVVGLVWIVVGLAIVIGVGRSLDLLPDIMAALLLLGGLTSFGDAVRGGRVTERVLAAAWGAAQVVFGILAFSWPDATVLVVAVIFGVRTTVFGITLTVRGGRAVFAGRRSAFAAEAAEEEAVSPGTAEAPPVPAGTPAAHLPQTRFTPADAGRILLAVVVVVAAGGAWWIGERLSEGSPVVDAFYDPPADLPAGHGVLLRDDEYVGRAPEGATVRRILYTTQDAHGEPAVASALVISPDEITWTPRPAVLWNHGTTGVARGCAPSLQDGSATKWAIPALDEALAAGWVVVAPDYSGQGAPGTFPYLIGLGEARSALDAVVAADQVVGVWLRDEVAIWGHSQGGHAALWASQIAADYTPQLDVVGTAALAPAVDPYQLASELATPDAPATLSILTAWVVVSYADTYADVDLRGYVRPGARAIVLEMSQRCPSEPGALVSLAAAVGVSEDTSLYVGDLTFGALGRRLEENAATGPWSQPLFVAWGTDDEVIPRDLQEAFVADACTAGTPVHWIVERGSDHRGVMVPGSRVPPALMRWTADRFAGVPASIAGCSFFASSP